MKYLLLGITKLTAVSIFTVSLLACGGAEERKTKYLEKSKVYLSDKNYDKAKVEIKNVLQIDPKSAEAYFLMGQIEEKNKELGKALGNYKKAIELEPAYTEAKIKLAKIYVIAGTAEYIKLASELLNETIKSQANNPEVNVILATIDYKLGEREKAISALEKVVAKHRSSVEGISLLATFYLINKESEKAVKLLSEGAANNLKNIPLRISLAKLLIKTSDYTKAEKYIKEALSIESERYELQVMLSVLYSSSDQKDKAEAVLRKAIKQDDNDPKRYLVLVEFLSSKVSVEEAEKELKAAIKNKPELYALKFSQITFYQKIGKTEEAKNTLKQIIAEKPYDVEGVRARVDLANLLLKEGDINGAEKYINNVLEEYPGNNEALLVASKLAINNLDAISAINSLRTVVKNSPKNAEASLLLAQAHELNNESSLAERELKKSLEANPINVQVHINYARYLGLKGRVDEAINVVDKALAYFKDSYELMELKLKILVSQNKKSETLALLDLMEQTNADRPEVNLMKGKYYLAKQDTKKAIEQFEKAYQKSRDKYPPLQLIVKSFIANGEVDKALKYLQQIIDEKPDNAIAHLLLGHIYLRQNKITQARNKYLRASKLAENWLPPYSGLATIFVQNDKIDKAIVVYQEAEKKLKNKVPAQLQIAALYEKQKNFSEAMNVYQKILSSNAANKLASNNYASLLLDYGNDSDSAQALELVKGFKNMQQPALQDTLGWAYAKTGDSAKAVEILKPIVEKSPKIAVFRYHLGFSLYYLGDKAAAKSHLEIAASSEQVFPGKDNAIKLLKTLKEI